MLINNFDGERKKTEVFSLCIEFNICKSELHALKIFSTKKSIKIVSAHSEQMEAFQWSHCLGAILPGKQINLLMNA